MTIDDLLRSGFLPRFLIASDYTSLPSVSQQSPTPAKAIKMKLINYPWCLLQAGQHPYQLVSQLTDEVLFNLINCSALNTDDKLLYLFFYIYLD
ncbi:hypothetical protein T4A_11072 [Trichinella pseudospiralis]|uniref:Uncharacterized protein n=1 Tax=Trichinella pseudospiralis TaxID=6337 RepID=A0A0V1ERQ8_TRIPS|nr:hypothetical protein T4A_11072 [Trichinella pseudospiralis]